MTEYIVRNLLQDTISTICSSAIPHKDSIKIDGLLAITIDQKQILILKIDKENHKNLERTRCAETFTNNVYQNCNQPNSGSCMSPQKGHHDQNHVTNTEGAHTSQTTPKASPHLHIKDLAFQNISPAVERNTYSANQLPPPSHYMQQEQSTSASVGLQPRHSFLQMPVLTNFCSDSDHQTPLSGQPFSEVAGSTPGSTITNAGMDTAQVSNSVYEPTHHIVPSNQFDEPQVGVVTNDNSLRKKSNMAATEVPPPVIPESSAQDQQKGSAENELRDVDQDDDDNAIVILDSPPPAGGTDVPPGRMPDEFLANAPEPTPQERTRFPVHDKPTTIAIAIAYSEPSSSNDAATGRSSATVAAAVEAGMDAGGRDVTSGQPSDTSWKTHICPICSKGFRFKCQLERHIIIHSGEKPFSCDICQKKFAMKASLKQHQRVHHRDSDAMSYRCKTCMKTFSKRGSLEQHVCAIAQNVTSVLEEAAEDQVNGAGSAKHGMGSTHNDRIADTTQELSDASQAKPGCENPSVAQLVSSSIQANWKASVSQRIRNLLNNHCSSENQTDVTGINKAPAACSTNSEKSSKNVKKYICTYCRKSLSSKQSLRDHVRMHTDERPFSCSCCSKSFRRKTSLQLHEYIHKGIKPFKCPTCGQCFRQPGALSIHRQKVHNR